MNELMFCTSKTFGGFVFPSFGANQEDLVHVSLFII
jgi:hypothetical protein